MVIGNACLGEICGEVKKAMADCERLVLRKSKGKVNHFRILKRETNSWHLAALWKALL